MSKTSVLAVLLLFTTLNLLPMSEEKAGLPRNVFKETMARLDQQQRKTSYESRLRYEIPANSPAQMGILSNLCKKQCSKSELTQLLEGVSGLHLSH